MKNKFGIFTAVFFSCFFILGSSVYAFTNSTYYENQNIMIGLESMDNSQLNITLDGDYTLNGDLCKSGTSYVITVSGALKFLNGVWQDTINFIPYNNSNTIKIV